MTNAPRLLAFAIALGLALPPLPAFAQPAQPSKQARDEAGVRFRKGVDLFKDGDFQAALIEFRRAYDLAPNFNVLYNIGQVYFQLQDYPDALKTLQRYLNDGGNQIPNVRRAEVEKDIEKLEARVATLEVSSNVAGADVAVDDAPEGKTPLGKAILVGAGRHKITVSKTGFATATKVVEMASGDSTKVTLDLTEEHAAPPVVVPVPVAPVQPPPVPPPAQPPPAPPPESSTPWAGWAITGGLVVGAGVFGGLALSASSNLKTQLASPAATRSSIDSAHDKTAALALVSDIFSGSAILAGGISLYLTVRGPSDSAKPGAPPPATGALRFQVLPGGVQASGSF
jgi:hypothetical protein